VDIVAIAALDEAFLNPVVVGLGEVCLGGRVASIAEIGLSF
jgi:hypothetical protein